MVPRVAFSSAKGSYALNNLSYLYLYKFGKFLFSLLALPAPFSHLLPEMKRVLLLNLLDVNIRINLQMKNYFLN